jgi:preprotein translocase subunit SecY
MRWPTDPTFWKRLGITAAVLAAYYLGMNVPMPGIDPGKLAQLAQSTDVSAIGRLSVVALGVMPLINALLLLEVLKLAAPGVRQWELASFRNRDRMFVMAICGALVMALLQATGFVSALEEVQGLVAEPGSTFRAVATTSMVAGSALVILFAIVIDRVGLGCGLWLLFLTPAIAELPGKLIAIAYVHGQGDYGSDLILLSAVYTVLGLAGVVGIVLAARAATATVATCVWTPFVATAVLTPALFMGGWLATFNSDWAVAFATPGHITWYLALALAALTTVWLYARSYAQAGEASPVNVAPIAGILAAILVGAPLLETTLNVVLPFGSAVLIVAAAVAATLLVRWGIVSAALELPPEDAPETTEQSADQSSGANR